MLLTSIIWSSAPAFVGNVLLPIALIALPVSIGVGILSYRLYEIDRLVSRTLSYAILTALLVGTFVGLVALSTDTLALSGRVGVAASTLAAAALFNPLRMRIQRLVDRRFNRARYDAEATVAAFTARLRDAVEIDAIRADLLDAVNRAVQPTHASVWIKRHARGRAGGHRLVHGQCWIRVRGSAAAVEFRAEHHSRLVVGPARGRAVRRLRRGAIGVAEQVGDDLARLLPARVRQPLKASGVFSFDADHDPQQRSWIAVVEFGVAGINRRQIGVEIARPGIVSCPRRVAHCPSEEVTLDVRRVPAGHDQPRRRVHSPLDHQRQCRPPSVRPISNRRVSAAPPPCGFRAVTCRFRGTCSASSAEMPRAPSFSRPTSVTSSSWTTSGTRSVYRTAPTELHVAVDDCYWSHGATAVMGVLQVRARTLYPDRVSRARQDLPPAAGSAGAVRCPLTDPHRRELRNLRRRDGCRFSKGKGGVPQGLARRPLRRARRGQREADPVRRRSQRLAVPGGERGAATTAHTRPRAL